MFKEIKQFLCWHDYEITNKEPLPGYIPGGGVLMSVEETCSKCGKTKKYQALSSEI